MSLLCPRFLLRPHRGAYIVSHLVDVSDHTNHQRKRQLFAMDIKSVALIGATSRVGPAVIAALEECKLFNLTIIQRESSKPPPPTSAAIVVLPNDLPDDVLIDALREHDALVSTMPGSAVEPHIKLANACVQAGVKRFIPADYGSVDSSDGVVAELVPLYKQKTQVREYLTQLSREHPAFSWTSLVCGHFFDYGLQTELLGFDVRKGTAQIFDDGERKWSASTLAQIGRAVAGVLRKVEETRNKMLYMQSFRVSQNDVMEALLEVGGRQFEVSFARSEDYIREQKKAMDEGDREAAERLVCVLGVTRADWTKERDFANELLGLKEEDVQAAVKEAYMEVVKSV